MSAAFIEVDDSDGDAMLVNVASISRIEPCGSETRIYFNAVSGFEGSTTIEGSHVEWIKSTNGYGEVVDLIEKAGAKIAFVDTEEEP